MKARTPLKAMALWLIAMILLSACAPTAAEKFLAYRQECVSMGLSSEIDLPLCVEQLMAIEQANQAAWAAAADGISRTMVEQQRMQVQQYQASPPSLWTATPMGNGQYIINGY